LWQVISHRVSHESGGGPLRTGGTEEIMSVPAFGADGDEDITLAKRPRICPESGDGVIRGDGPAPGRPGG
jgi:hypothetical protein